MERWKVQLASLPDKENLVAEIWYERELWAEISNEEDLALLTIYPRRDGEEWQFELDSALDALSRAKERLLGNGNAQTSDPY